MMERVAKPNFSFCGLPLQFTGNAGNASSLWISDFGWDPTHHPSHWKNPGSLVRRAKSSGNCSSPAVGSRKRKVEPWFSRHTTCIGYPCKRAHEMSQSLQLRVTPRLSYVQMSQALCRWKEASNGGRDALSLSLSLAHSSHVKCEIGNIAGGLRAMSPPGRDVLWIIDGKTFGIENFIGKPLERNHCIYRSRFHLFTIQSGNSPICTSIYIKGYDMHIYIYIYRAIYIHIEINK